MKRRDTGIAVGKSSNHTNGFFIISLNSKIDILVPGQPEFKETVRHCLDNLVDKNFTVLPYRFHINIRVGQVPLTGGHIMRSSAVGVIYVGSNSHHHLILRQRYPFNLISRELKDHFF